MPEPKNKYFKIWRDKNSWDWQWIQLKWYFKNRQRITGGWKKPESAADDSYDKWSRRFD